MDDYKQVLRDALALHQGGRFDEAMTRYRAVLAQLPDEPNATYLLGVALHQATRHDQAVAYLTRACEQRPDFADAFNNLGEALRGAKRAAEAVVALEKALALKPDHPAYLANLSHARLAVKDEAGAVDAARKAIALEPGLVAAHQALGNALLECGRIEDARAALERAVQLAPDFHDARINLAMLESKYGDSYRAIEVFEALGKSALDGADWYARALARVGRAAAAREVRVCKIAEAATPAALIGTSALLFHANYDTDSADDLYAMHRDWGERLESMLGVPVPHVRTRTLSPIRVGFVSNDFRRHSCAHFLLPLLSALDPERVSVVLYSDVKEPDDVTARLRSMAALWREIRGVDDGIVAECIRSDDIDVLVDLGGHTADTRLGVFARRAAPVQATWLGYANTTGLSRIDWRFTDAVADPPGAEAHYSEKLWRFEGGFLRFAPFEAVALPQRAPFAGGFRFGSFNALDKISPACWRVWTDILRAVPEATLLLKSFALKHPATMNAWRSRVAGEGLTGRVRLVPFVESETDHLALYDQIDLALDTAPYGGTTTSCEALWQGVPLLTMAGRRHAARVGASLLAQIPNAGVIAADWDNYRDVAIGLTKNRDALSALGHDLASRVRTGRLADGTSLAREMTRAFETMMAF